MKLIKLSTLAEMRFVGAREAEEAKPQTSHRLENTKQAMLNCVSIGYYNANATVIYV